MTNPEPHIISLSAELARMDDDARRQTAQRWQAAVHRLCLLRATANASSYEAEWLRIMEHEPLMEDLHNPSKLIVLAAVDVLEVQHEQKLIVCRANGIALDEDAMEEMSELIAGIRMRVVDDQW